MNRKSKYNIVLICFTTYMCVYLCRVNFSAAMTRISEKLTLDYGMLGGVGAAFFAIYAIGQLLNGMIGDHINPFGFILTALCGTIVCNLAVGFSTQYWQIMVAWGLNGYFQSIFWSTIIRILALKGDKDKQASMSSTISAAMPTGYFLSWCVLTPFLDATDPKWNFIIPAILAGCLIPVWIKTKVEDRMPSSFSSFSIIKSADALLALIRKENLTLVLIACVCHGLIKEGIGFWIPFLVRQIVEKPEIVICLLALLPAANYVGTQLAKRMLQRKGDSPIALVRAFFLAMLPICLLLKAVPAVAILILMAVISSCSYGANTILMSYIPMQYQRQNMVSSVVGILDFCSYMGAAISSYALGSIMDRYGFTFVPWIWLGTAFAAYTLLGISNKKNKKVHAR